MARKVDFSEEAVQKHRERDELKDQVFKHLFKKLKRVPIEKWDRTHGVDPFPAMNSRDYYYGKPSYRVWTRYQTTINELEARVESSITVPGSSMEDCELLIFERGKNGLASSDPSGPTWGYARDLYEHIHDRHQKYEEQQEEEILKKLKESL